MRTIWFLSWCAIAVPAAGAEILPDQPNAMAFPAEKARFVRIVVHQSSTSQPCIDELEIYGADGERNLALATGGAKASASSCLPGYAIHRIEHLNDGKYGNGQSWIAAGTTAEWAQIELPATRWRISLPRRSTSATGRRRPTTFT
ncbi:MAG: hypothetical protein HQ567_28605 [Candidatus Nealsonbacteria bacterium]|nr:hypothetical protein [Candidatus Nealsonbacteria bacterium]